MSATSTTSERIPPHNLEAEQSVLGSLLLGAGDAVFGTLEASDFYRPTHAAIFEAAKRLYIAESPIDHVSLADELERSNKLEQVGGKVYLLDITQVVPTASGAERYAAIVKRTSRLRALIKVAGSALESAYAGEDNALDGAMSGMLSLQDTGKTSARRLSEVTAERIDAYSDPLPTVMLPGSGQRLHFGDVVAIGGWEGSGKTAFAAIQALDIWRVKHKCLLLSYEMTAAEIVDRFISRAVGMPSDYAWDGLTQDEMSTYRKACSSLLADSNLTIKECAGMVPSQLFATIKAFAASGGKIAVLDYIQIARDQSRDERPAIDSLMVMLQQVCKSTGVLLLALSQYARHEGEPKLSNLRGSGAIGHAVANAGLMWAPEGKDPKTERDAQTVIKEKLRKQGFMVIGEDPRIVVRLDWAKARHSAKTREYYVFDGSKMTFTPLERERT